MQMLSSKDINFVGYTYKNFEIVNDYQVPGMGIALSHKWIQNTFLCYVGWWQFYIHSPAYILFRI